MHDSSLPSDADDTALATLALIRSKQDGAGDAIQRGIEWLTQNQATDGSWSTYQPGQGDVGCVSITAHAVEALLEYGGNQTVITRGIRWLRTAIHGDGFWDDLWLAKRTYGTACALAALIKAGVKGCTGDCTRGAVVRASTKWRMAVGVKICLETLRRAQWNKRRGVLTPLLLATTDENRAAQNGITFLLKHQRENGSWPESCVGIYWEVIGGYSDPIYASVFPILALDQYIR